MYSGKRRPKDGNVLDSDTLLVLIKNVQRFTVVFPARSETRTTTCIGPSGYAIPGVYSMKRAVRTEADVTS